jgi:hypothetical protein
MRTFVSARTRSRGVVAALGASDPELPACECHRRVRIEIAAAPVPADEHTQIGGAECPLDDFTLADLRSARSRRAGGRSCLLMLSRREPCEMRRPPYA